MDPEIVTAITLVTENGVRNDRALLTLCEALVERVTSLESKVHELELNLYSCTESQESMERRGVKSH